MTPRRWMIYSVLQRSLGVGECFGAASELHLLADVIPPLLATIALFAGLSNFQSDLVADLEPLRFLHV